MIRTRDLLLFVVVLGFLFLGISWSVTGDLAQRSHEEKNNDALRFDVADVTQDYNASVSGFKDVDRAENIRRLKEKLAQNTSYTNVDSVDRNQVSEAALEGTMPESGGGVRETPLLCEGYVSQPLYAFNWNTARMSLTFIEGARVVMEEVERVVGVGTSTIVETVSIPRMQLPSFRERGIDPFCIPDGVVGVALDGGLILNGDAVRFQNRTSEDMIGYARDGFPIYGTIGDTEALDECGGILEGGSYRYHLRTDDPFILGCFGAPPASILE